MGTWSRTNLVALVSLLSLEWSMSGCKRAMAAGLECIGASEVMQVLALRRLLLPAHMRPWVEWLSRCGAVRWCRGVQTGW